MSRQVLNPITLSYELMLAEWPAQLASAFNPLEVTMPAVLLAGPLLRSTRKTRQSRTPYISYK